MKEEYISIIKENNEEIEKTRADILKYYNVETKKFDYSYDDSFSEEQLKEIIGKQEEEIAALDVISEIEAQNLAIETEEKIEELKKEEKDPEFSKFYRTGKVTIGGADVDIDEFYLKVMANSEGSTRINVVCTDDRIKNGDDGEFDNMLEIYPLRKTSALYNMYLDKKLYNNNKIIIGTNEQMELFKKYINNWDRKNHTMVAETML